MKNLAIWVLIIAVVVLGYFLIKKNKAVLPVEQSTDNSEVKPADEKEGSSFLENTPEEKVISEETEVYVIKARYPAVGNTVVDSELKSFIQSEVAVFKSENSEPFPGQVAKYSFGSTYKIIRGGGAISFIFTLETYSGGAHGNIAMKTFVYSSDAKKLSIGSFFKPGSNYLAKLSEITRKKLGEKSDEIWYEEGTEPVSTNFDSFYISTEGKLVIIFQPYQVGPWVAGTPEVSIGFDELGDIVHEDYR
jgi:hypothetical protein